jgi:nucleotidyltransferase/DNA polymerase involved in DNA repair
MNAPRSVVHLDADAFFASVEQAADVHLRGKPVAVGGEKRGIIASASYEARKMGIYTPMPTSRARRLCPKLIIVPGDFEKYERFSKWMFSYAYDFTPDVEISSIDEGYLDITANRKPPIEIAAVLKNVIGQSLKITVSEGIAQNKLVSQIVAKVNKPAAFKEIPPGEEKIFLTPLANHWLPGIGPKTAARLNAAGLALIGHIAETPLDLLGLLLGKTAPQIREFANGIDERPVVAVDAPAKSYGHQETFNADTTDEQFVDATLRHMADRLMAAVRDEGKTIRTFTVKVRYNDMAEEQGSESLLEPTDLETDVYGRISLLLRRTWSRRVSLRMVSLKFSNIYENFFRADLPIEDGTRQREARRRLSAVVDDLRRTHGEQIVIHGHDFDLNEGRSDGQKKHLAKSMKPRDTETFRPPSRRALKQTSYIPLRVRSQYSFLDSALSVEAIVELAKKYELPAIAIADRNGLHGAVEFVQAASAAGVKPIIGVEIEVEGKPLSLYVENERGYRNLCRILTNSNNCRSRSRVAGEALINSELSSRRGRGVEKISEPFPQSGIGSYEYVLNEFLIRHFDGLIGVSSDPRLAEHFPGRFYFGISHPDDLRRAPANLPLIANLAAHYETPADRIKFDILQSIRTRTLLKQAHPQKRLDGDFHFQTPAEISELFAHTPGLMEHTRELADRCSFQFPFGKPQFPRYYPKDGSPAAEFLCTLVYAGLKKRYRDKAAQYKRQIDQELAIINEVGYAEYFLAVWDILQDCRRRGIEWITRGSAADSLVCYCLEISDVCPIRFDLYFRRFLNKDRMMLDKLPDIDIDFAHDVKDDVIDLIFAKYGEEQVAVVGGFSTYKARSAIGDIAKVLGVSEFQIRRFTEHIPHTHAQNLEQTIAETQECRDLPVAEEPYSTAVKMAQFMDGFPRYPKMHPCGVVISRGPMLDLTPCFVSNKGYPTTHFDMESVEVIGLIKMDILAQGGLAVMRDVRRMLGVNGNPAPYY